MDRRIKVDSHPIPEPGGEEQVLFIEAVPVTKAEIETICHRRIIGDPAFYPQEDFHGRTIYFCTQTCQSVFLSDPERFYAAHSKRRPG
jgi:YHS domain-containing protein